ncbi:MAG: helix-turn-helix domain-containing protein [Candidatus Paceibacterota bacterium]|jgi:excisionase family DNA binding protein
MSTQSAKIIWAVKGICEYCGISRDTFYRLVRSGKFPAAVIEGKWCAHMDNIDDFFRLGTKTPPKNLDTDAE